MSSSHIAVFLKRLATIAKMPCMQRHHLEMKFIKFVRLYYTDYFRFMYDESLNETLQEQRQFRSEMQIQFIGNQERILSGAMCVYIMHTLYIQLLSCICMIIA